MFIYLFICNFIESRSMHLSNVFQINIIGKLNVKSEMPVGLGPCDEWLNNTVCVWRFSWLVSLQVIGGDWTCGDVWRMKIWCHADGLRAVKGGSRLAFEGFEIVRCMSTVPDDTARERWWTVSWLSHKTKIPDVRCGGRGRRRGQLSIARRFRIIVRRDHGTPWC
jgi:hypothetical protein